MRRCCSWPAIASRRIDRAPELAGVEPDYVARRAGVDDDIARAVIPVGNHFTGAARTADAAMQFAAIRRRGDDAWRLGGAAPCRQRLREHAHWHQDPFAALADLDVLAIVHDGAPQWLLADGAVVARIAGDPHAVRRGLWADERGAVAALPAGAIGQQRHGCAAVGTIHARSGAGRLHN